MDELLRSLRRGFGEPIEEQPDDASFEDIPLDPPSLLDPPSPLDPSTLPTTTNIRDIFKTGKFGEPPTLNLAPMENLNVTELKDILTEEELYALIMDDMVYGSDRKKEPTCVGDLVSGLNADELDALLRDANDHHTNQRKLISTPSMFNVPPNTPTTNHFRASETSSTFNAQPTETSYTQTPTVYNQSYYGMNSTKYRPYPITPADKFNEKLRKPEQKTFQEFKQQVEISTPFELKNLLIDAARKGVIRDIEILVTWVKLNGMPDFLHSALIEAVKNDHLTVAKFLVKYGANPLQENNLPLISAVANGNSDMVKYLIKIGADVNLDNGRLLYECCLAGDYVDVLKVLIDNGINVFSYYQKALLVCSNKPLCQTYLVKHNISNAPHEEPMETYDEIYDDDDYDGIILRPDEYFNSDSADKNENEIIDV